MSRVLGSDSVVEVRVSEFFLNSHVFQKHFKTTPASGEKLILWRASFFITCLMRTICIIRTISTRSNFGSRGSWAQISFVDTIGIDWTAMAEDPLAPVACLVITCQCPDFDLEFIRKRWTATCGGCSERLFWREGDWMQKVIFHLFLIPYFTPPYTKPPRMFPACPFLNCERVSFGSWLARSGT